MKNDLIFLLVLAIFVGYYLCKRESFGNIVEGFSMEDARKAVREIYTADIEAIRNLSEVSKKLQAGGLTHPGRLTINSGGDNIPLLAASNTDSHILLRTKNDGNKDTYLINRDGHFRMHMANVGDIFNVDHNGHHYVRHTGDHVMHIDGDGVHPYISLGKTGTWNNQKLYLQNVNAHTDNPTFRVGRHGAAPLLDISANGYLHSSGARFNAGGHHIPLEVSSNTDSHILLRTKGDENKNVYLINRDGHFKVHHHGIGDRLHVNRDGHTHVSGAFFVNGRNILAELDRLNARFPNRETLQLENGAKLVHNNNHWHLLLANNCASAIAYRGGTGSWGGWC